MLCFLDPHSLIIHFGVPSMGIHFGRICFWDPLWGLRLVSLQHPQVLLWAGR